MNEMTRILAAPADSYTARFTAEEFTSIARTGEGLGIKLELINGGLERMSPPMGAHVKFQTSIIAGLIRAADKSALLAGVEVGIQLDVDNVVTCDAALLAIAEFPNRFLQPAEVVLAVEIADATLYRDQGPKRVKYALASIPEYWVVDIARAVIHRYRNPQQGEYAQVDTVNFGEPLAVPGTDATITLS